jgi:UDP-N-acetylmuramoylalanine--D-glutamate ligase
MQERIVILGAGESGTGAALLAKARNHDVFVSDFGIIKENFKKELFESGISFEEETHTYAEILNATLVIKSPGIPESAPIMIEVREKGIKVVSEIEFAALNTSAQFVAITGTNGKTTTTLLTYHILKECGFKVGLAGNVGESLARQVLKYGPDGRDYYVTELSSFQLDDLFSFKAHVAILLNITPDHLDRYENNFSMYRDSKFRVIQNMNSTDVFIYWKEDQVIQEKILNTLIISQQIAVSLEKGGSNDSAHVEEDSLVVNGHRYPLEALPLKGKHNCINMMAAISAATFLGIEGSDIEYALKTYVNVAHRMELAGNISGITFINDSKATNVDSVYYALDAFDKSITWIAGGVDKGNNYNQLKSLVEEKVTALICLGKDNAKLKEAFGGILNTILETEDIREAARLGYEYAHKNDVVLLSPACASFDLFRNYEDRGDQFKDAVNELKKEVEVKTD